MSASFEEVELVVGDDGTIPADQLAALGFEPGSHLRVLAPAARPADSIAGKLTTWPELTWDDFERAGAAPQGDLRERWGRRRLARP